MPVFGSGTGCSAGWMGKVSRLLVPKKERKKIIRRTVTQGSLALLSAGRRGSKPPGLLQFFSELEQDPAVRNMLFKRGRSQSTALQSIGASIDAFQSPLPFSLFFFAASGPQALITNLASKAGEVLSRLGLFCDRRQPESLSAGPLSTSGNHYRPRLCYWLTFLSWRIGYESIAGWGREWTGWYLASDRPITSLRRSSFPTVALYLDTGLSAH